MGFVMKRVMVLGASYSLIPLIKTIKDMGMQAIVTSIPGDYPGFTLADEVCYADITKPEEVLEYARKLNIDAVATCCMDVGLKSLGYVNSELGLCGPSANTVQLCTNKYLMKNAFVKEGVNTAKYVQIYCEEDLERAFQVLSFPLIIKAVDLMGSRGIFRCDTKEEVRSYYHETMSSTNLNYCILEEFLVGTMFGVEAMVQNGKLTYFLPVSNELHKANPPFPIGHFAPWNKTEELYDKIQKQIQLAVNALGADNCPMDFDMMEKDGEIYIIEATARAGATGMTDLVGIHYSINYFEAIVRCALGMDVSDLFAVSKEERKPALTYLLESDKTGTLKEIQIEEIKDENIIDFSFNVEPGDEIRIMQNGRDRIGQIILTGESEAGCRTLLQDLLHSYTLEIV